MADLGRGPRNLVLQPTALTTELFLCSLLWAWHLFTGQGPPNSYQMVINFYSRCRPELDLNQHLRGAKALCIAHYWSLELCISLVNVVLPTVNASQKSPKSRYYHVSKKQVLLCAWYYLGLVENSYGKGVCLCLYLCVHVLFFQGNIRNQPEGCELSLNVSWKTAAEKTYNPWAKKVGLGGSWNERCLVC